MVHEFERDFQKFESKNLMLPEMQYFKIIFKADISTNTNFPPLFESLPEILSYD